MATFAPPPHRSVEQMMTALGSANERRMSGAQFKREMLALERRRDALPLLARTLRENPGRVGNLRIHKLLEATPGLGPVAVRKILTRQQIWPLRTVDELTERQRLALGDVLMRRAGGWQ